MSNIKTHTFDAVIVGAGGAGLAGVLMLSSLAIENPYVAAAVLAAESLTQANG
jgi:succinate dehydrogenase/fumarate reductase flavoprotein subunit